MVIPIITSLSREVFSQAPQGEREAAYALGSTRWGMVRTVVLPFGRSGIVGAILSCEKLAGAEGFEPPSSVLETDSLTVELTPLNPFGNLVIE